MEEVKPLGSWLAGSWPGRGGQAGRSLMLGSESRPVRLEDVMGDKVRMVWSQITERLVCYVKKFGGHGGYTC